MKKKKKKNSEEIQFVSNITCVFGLATRIIELIENVKIFSKLT